MIFLIMFEVAVFSTVAGRQLNVACREVPQAFVSLTMVELPPRLSVTA